MNIPCILSIAGTDPTCGAGIQADLKTISALKGYAATVITSLVAQNTCGVQDMRHIDKDFVYTQIKSVCNDLQIKTVKIGMLFGEELIQTVIRAINDFDLQKIVIDPVMIAKSGDSLIESSSFKLYKTKFLPHAYLITPNVVECEYLLDKKIKNYQDMKLAALELANIYNTNVLLKGGHLNDTQFSQDLLFDQNQNKTFWFQQQRIVTKNTHGTGCSLSSAIATFLAHDLSLYDAVLNANKYIHNAIKNSIDFKIGKGNGPLDHFYYLRKEETNLSI